jgi:zinc/manganese transport system ATP-binding protein
VLSNHAEPLPCVRLRGGGVDFDGRAALEGIDLDLLPASLTVVAGPNGAGKSTLLEVVAGTRPLSRGTRVSSCVTAFVPQRTSVSDRLPVTVRDVVTVGTWGRSTSPRHRGGAGRETVDTALDRLGIADLAAESFSSLSGGQRQRTLLAQGLVGGADLLLLDEPTTGLDRESSGRIRDIMQAEAHRGVAVVCVSHDPAVLAVAGRVIRLDDGRIGADTLATAEV